MRSSSIEVVFNGGITVHSCSNVKNSNPPRCCGVCVFFLLLFFFTNNNPTLGLHFHFQELTKYVNFFLNDDTVVGGSALISASWTSLLCDHICQSYMVRVTNTVFIYILHLCPCSASRTYQSSFFFSSNCVQQEIVFLRIVFAHVSI